MSSVFQSGLRLTTAFCLSLGVGFSPSVSAQCNVDADTATAIDRLQLSQDRYAVTGTFLRESAVGRDFVSVTRDSGEGAGSAKFVNSSAINSEQALSLPAGRYLDPCEVAKLYSVTLARGPKVAGKATQVLQFRPRDTLRLGHVLALEEQSGVVLRSDTISEKGELLERHEFATVTISEISTSASSSSTSASSSNAPSSSSPSSSYAMATEDTNRELDADRPRYVKVPGLPDGYRASLARGYEGRALFVSDGIAAATVIFEPLPSTVKPGEGAVRRGATLTYTRGSLVSGKNILVTVIGEVPLAAARVIADAVKLTAGQR